MTETFAQSGFIAFVSSLSGVTLVDQWDASVAKVGGKVFSLLNSTGDVARIVVKCSQESFEILTALPDISQAPYFAKRTWISISASSPLSEDEVRHYIEHSHMLVAAGLTKKLRAELGIQGNA